MDVRTAKQARCEGRGGTVAVGGKKATWGTAAVVVNRACLPAERHLRELKEQPKRSRREQDKQKARQVVKLTGLKVTT